MSDATTETKSAAFKFLETHENMEKELMAAKQMIAEQRNELEQQYFKLQYQTDQIKTLNEKADRYLRYAVELSSQLQFIVSGAARALQIAQTVKQEIVTAAKIPEVPGADVAQLEDIMKRISANAETAENTTTESDLKTVQ